MNSFNWRRVAIAALLTILAGLLIMPVPNVHALKQVQEADGTVTVVIETQEEALAVLNQQNAVIKQLRQQLADKRKLECNLI